VNVHDLRDNRSNLCAPFDRGALVGSTLADRWTRKTNRVRIYASAIGMVQFLPALFGVGNAPTLTFAIVGLMIFGLGWGFFDGNNMPI
jgi:hypothetical protein